MLGEQSSVATESTALTSNELTQEINQTQEVFTGEEINVAGLKTGLGKIIGETIKETIQPIKKSVTRKQPIKSNAEPIDVIDTSLLPKSETIVDTNAIQSPTIQPTSSKNSVFTEKQKQMQDVVQSEKAAINPEEILAQQNVEAEKIAKMREEGERLVPGKLTFNYEVLNTTDDVSSLIETNAKLFGISTEKINFKDVIKSAENLGFSKQYVNDLVNGKLGVDPIKSYQTNMLLEIVNKDSAKKLAQVAKGNVTEQQANSIMKDLTFNSVLIESALGYKSNIGASLGVMKMPINDMTKIGDFSAIKDFDEFRKFAESYTKSNKETQNKLISNLTRGATISKLNNIYIGGILSRPGTHIKNIVSTLSTIPLRMVHTGVASGLDISRYNFGKLIGNDVSRSVYFSEVLSQIVATKKAFENGFQALRVAKQNQLNPDALIASKMETQKFAVDIFSLKEGDSNFYTGFAKTINYLAQAPGKALFSADEVMKGINYTFELESFITRQSIKAHDEVLAKKGTIEEAATAYDNTATFLYDNPPDFLHDLALENVFLKPLEPGLLKTFKDVSNNPSLTSLAIKQYVPFVQTPSNVYSQVFEEIPVVAFATKKARADISSGDPARVQTALAKQATGTALMLYGATLATDGDITGPGPKDKAERQRLIDQGWQPYSIVMDLSWLPGIKRKKYDKDDRLVKGTGNYEGKYFFSYVGLEPIGALLSMGAGYSDYARYEDNQDSLSSFIHGSVPAIGEYAVSHPLLEGAARVGEFVSNIQSTMSDEKLDKSINEFISGLGVRAYKSVLPLSGLQKSARELYDPYEREYKVDSKEYGLLAGVLEAQNKIYNNVPGLSDYLPRKINIWNEELTYDTAISPLRATKGKALEANQILIATGTKYNAPSNIAEKTIEGTGIPLSIKLTDKEYNEMISIANERLLLSERIISKWNVLSTSIDLEAVKGTPVQLKKVQMGLAQEMETVFRDARNTLIQDSEYSDAIQQRFYDELEKVNEDVVESPDEFNIR